MAAGDLTTSQGYIFTAADVELFVSSLLEKIQSTQKDPGQYSEVTSLDGVSSLPCFHVSGSAYELVRVAIASLKGVDGKSIEMQVNADNTKIQYRLVGADTWTDLIALSVIEQPAIDAVVNPLKNSTYADGTLTINI
jgi:hypothetical protein